MNTRTEIISKLNELKSYSSTKDALTEPLFTPIYSAVDSYFSGSNVASALECAIKYLYNDITRRTTKHEHHFDMKLPTNYPAGYFDIRECFYNFKPLLEVSNEAFFASFVYGVPEGAGGSEEGGAAEPVPISNTLLTSWTQSILAAKTGDETNINNLANWCLNSGGNCDLICLFENQGRIVESLSVKEKADIIFVERHAKEVIETLGLDVYIPSYE